MPAPSLLDQLWSTPVPPKAVPRHNPNGPASDDEIRAYLAATTQNYPNFSRMGVNPDAFEGWLEQAPESQNIDDRREPPPRRTGRLRIGKQSYGAE